MADYTSKDIARFWSKVAMTADDSKCWEWLASKDKDGYGKFATCRQGKHRHMKSNRVAWEIANGEILNGLWVLHKCDNPQCCNPNHLFLGTVLDNNRDKVAKGHHDPSRGELNGQSKLTLSQVQYIRDRYAQGNISMRELANEMRVSTSNIHLIVNGQRWKV